jgi:hypothetical protein
VTQPDPWLARLPARLELLSAFDLDDVTPEALEEVEDFLLDDASDEVMEGVAAFLGEAMLRLAGGAWAPATGAEVPPVELDPALGQAPIHPLHMVREAVGEDDGTVLPGAYAELERIVAAHRAADPSWTPFAGDAAFLPSWLAEQEAAFPGWAGPDGPWDFTPESLDRLGALVVRLGTFPPVAEWYLGETLRRAGGGQWRYRTGVPEFDPYAERPYVEQDGPDGEAVVPRLALEHVAGHSDPQHLRRRLAQFSE